MRYDDYGVTDAELNEVRQRNIDLFNRAEELLGSDLGEALLAKAVAKQNKAFQDLLESNPEDIEEIRRLQNECKIPRLFLAWLNELIDDGEVALADRREELPEGQTK